MYSMNYKHRMHLFNCIKVLSYETILMSKITYDLLRLARICETGDLLSQAVLQEPGCAMETALANCPGYEVSRAMMNNSNDQVCVLGHSS